MQRYHKKTKGTGKETLKVSNTHGTRRSSGFNLVKDRIYNNQNPRIEIISTEVRGVHHSSAILLYREDHG